MVQSREHRTPIFHSNEVLFGHDSTPGLIAFEIEGTDRVRTFRRQDGKTETATALFHPFMLLTGDANTKVKISENCKLTTQWDPQHPDENVEHYKAKLKELYEKFKPWFEFENVPPQNDPLESQPLLL